MITREDRGPLSFLRLAYGKANVLDTDFAKEIAATLAELEEVPARALVVTGTGSIFSAGVDIRKLTEGGAEYVREFLPALDACLKTLFCFPKPIVAAINGHAIAGGCVVASACDYRIMAKGSGRIGVAELLVGVPFPVPAFELMRFIAPRQHFQEIVYTGRTYTPEEALSRGLADEVVEPEALVDRATAIAQQLASIPPETFRMTKQQARQPVLERIERYEAKFQADIAGLWASPRILAAVKDYVARTIKK